MCGLGIMFKYYSKLAAAVTVTVRRHRISLCCMLDGNLLYIPALWFTYLELYNNFLQIGHTSSKFTCVHKTFSSMFGSTQCLLSPSLFSVHRFIEVCCSLTNKHICTHRLPIYARIYYTAIRSFSSVLCVVFRKIIALEI